jgi:hypothetical protein
MVVEEVLMKAVEKRFKSGVCKSYFEIIDYGFQFGGML